MEGSSNIDPPKVTPDPEINQQKAKILLQKLKEEIAQAKATTDPAKAKQHYQVAEKIKRVLLNYQASQAKKDGTDTASAVPVTGPSTVPPSAGESRSTSPEIKSPVPQRPSSVPAPTTTSAATPPVNNELQGQKITIERFNHVKNRMKEVYEGVKKLEQAHSDEKDAAKKQTINEQMERLKGQLVSFQKLAVYMKNQLVQQGRISGSTTPVNVNTSPTPVQPPQTQAPAPAPAPQQPQQAPPPPQEISSPAKTKSIKKEEPAVVSPQKSKSKSITPASVTTSITPKPDSVRPELAKSVSVKLNMTKPTITPSITSASTTHLSSLARPDISQLSSNTITPNNIPDNGGRVLTKRKLVELINNLGVDQGDSKMTIDGDVEDLFLDLADDFVRSVVGFSCRLAKHRKIDRIDIRDLQVNLERNWGLRVPGYSSDEIRAARKWASSDEYSDVAKRIEQENRGPIVGKKEKKNSN
ncbi:uncharacterized protein SPAPADRAFT_62384 [Spathaspora passalidarum NRRL Y-27907]|uniref:Transcription initiation factor TFIID subunit 12 domain-containing protein n=1 Tax=Spathaspora passalidarum (strain NRRL Y-27907 / 11-Y1) TaxID=619300 RepID=G3ARN8_SPAPN|nr:uncharacterized protein SPAPADRAFT_62384 [Spathaspora passalidarum NRRL Y-27907]EGW31791.1 hypothetical protein SPAPADRAFT_62384 [Spathaspora passalidarum NRRL Y-27907]